MCPSCTSSCAACSGAASGSSSTTTRGTSARGAERRRRRGDRHPRRGAHADGVFLDTLKEARPELRDALRAGVALEGESTVPLARIADHQLSWAQWFADSRVPGVIRAKWFEQRHMLHHTRRWNRDHLEELRSAWLNGAGVLLWDAVFGSGSAGTTATASCCARCCRCSASSPSCSPAASGRRSRRGATASRRRSSARAGATAGRRCGRSRTRARRSPASCTARRSLLELPAGGIAAVVGSEVVMVAPSDAGRARRSGRARRCAVGRRPSSRWRSRRRGSSRRRRRRRARRRVFRRRETGTYGEAPYVEEWKPLPPRLHDLVEVPHDTVAAPRFAIGAARGGGHGRRPAHRPDARRGAALRGGRRCASADRGRVAARRRGGPAGAPQPARLELDGERALATA